MNKKVSNKEKQIYQANRERVFSIYGIDPKDRRYNCHHIQFRNDFDHHPDWPQDYQDSKANLIPMLEEEHRRLHEKVDGMEERVLYQAPKRKTKKKYRLKDLRRLMGG